MWRLPSYGGLRDQLHIFMSFYITCVSFSHMCLLFLQLVLRSTVTGMITGLNNANWKDDSIPSEENSVELVVKRICYLSKWWYNFSMFRTWSQKDNCLEETLCNFRAVKTGWKYRKADRACFIISDHGLWMKLMTPLLNLVRSWIHGEVIIDCEFWWWWVRGSRGRKKSRKLRSNSVIQQFDSIQVLLAVREIGPRYN